ncbi:DSBA oxidoreductase [Dissoconium aciculare CBS 342.82]|uniref:DSBA oxidoreductase n=1 Tax=Dissoconium aciculare CBS 342.82 TaxID=1314786 RepID=A0A6J3LWA8_9PEZI|nr:DSBA oxidoreductase [Dissoconium aciculare CBS 342.82]KAF1820051.1 DSBA oxidoreductase [Dissoconium aciculare CBS 342.82]
MVVLNINSYFDTICPWCYIGEKNLDRAIETYRRTYPGGSKDEFKFTYKPFYLDRDAPTPGTPMRERITQKNGDMASGIITRLERTGRGCGINFTFQGRIGNTRDSHRLVRFVQREANSEPRRVVENLFHDLFEGSSDISSRQDLARAAVAAGLDGDEVAAFLETDEEGPEADELAAQARLDGVRHVPTFEINGFRVEGADDPSEFFEILVKAREAASHAA